MINILTLVKRKPYNNEIEDTSKFWAFEVDNYTQDEFIYLQRILPLYANFALIGCHHDEKSCVDFIHGFVILKKRRTKLNLSAKLSLDKLNLAIARGNIRDQVVECLGGKSYWQHGELIFKFPPEDTEATEATEATQSAPNKQLHKSNAISQNVNQFVATLNLSTDT